MKKRLLTVALAIALCFCFVLPAVAADPVPVEKITLDREEAVVSVNKSVLVKATVEPKKATAKKPEWSSSDETVATVINGKVTGVAPGTAVITAAAADESGVKASLTVTVVIPVSKITVEDAKLSLPPGVTWEQIAYVEPKEATLKNLVWESSDDRIATVDEHGVISSIAVGRCNIIGSAMDDSKKKVVVPVQVKEYDAVILTPGDQVVEFGMAVDAGMFMGIDSSGRAVQSVWDTDIVFDTGCVEKVNDNTLRPLKVGSDTVTIIRTNNGITTGKTKHTVFVAQSALREQGAVPEISAGGEILFRDIPWGSSFSEVSKIVGQRDETLKSPSIRNDMLWTRIEGELNFGSYKAYNNGLSFACESIDKDSIEANKDTCSFCMADYYFDPEIPFDNLKQNVMKTYGLAENETTDSDSECSWTVGNVSLSLSAKPKFTQLKMTCN